MQKHINGRFSKATQFRLKGSPPPARTPLFFHMLRINILNDVKQTEQRVDRERAQPITIVAQLFVFALSDFLLPLYYLALRRPRRPVDM